MITLVDFMINNRNVNQKYINRAITKAIIVIY